MDNSVDSAFNLCADNIANLPSKFKKWKRALSQYRMDWDFIFDSQTRNGIAEQEMGLDYLWSLDEWLNPGLTFESHQKLLFIQGLGAIYEAILKDLLKSLIVESNLNPKLKKIQIGKLQKDNFAYLIDSSRKSELITDDWSKYINGIRSAQNLGHIINTSPLAVVSEIFGKSMEELKQDLILFRNFIKERYGGTDEIPF